MDLKQKLVDLAIEASGDPEISVAGDFEPKGMMWKSAAGAAAGSLVGGAATGGNSWAQSIGAVGGMTVGSLSAGASMHLPPVVVVAASPTKLFVMATNKGQQIFMAKNFEVLSVLDREQVVVTLKRRKTVRTVVIEDEVTGEQFKLEGIKFGFHHINDLLAEIDQEEHDTATAESEARIAAAEANPDPASKR